eukprot:TRINITY_DN3958_c0_g1_i4.p1 TRINITY_DN3958_c0_g1~~TRINITY_DN3958_c0_g1_i4.p1  ORF type:complete len:632 (+),score=84.39 TRINITY_DN3958_c0_g1_i4:151-2046(+)
MFLRANVTIEKATIYIILENEDEDSYSFRIENTLPDVTIRAYQVGTDENLGFLMEPQTQKPFSWISPVKDKIVNIDFNFHDHGFKTESKMLSLDKINLKYRFAFAPTDILLHQAAPKKVITADVFVEKSTKVLKFTSGKDEELANEPPKPKNDLTDIKMIVEVKIRRLGISLIGNVQRQRRELIYIFLRSLKVVYVDFHIAHELNCVVRYFNTDNNSTLQSIYPVLITPTNVQAILQEKIPVFQFSIQVSKDSKQILQINSLHFQLAKLIFRAEDFTISYLFEFFAPILANFRQSKKNELSLFFEADELSKPKPEWITTEKIFANISGKLFYLKRLDVSAIRLNTTFLHTYRRKGTETNQLFNSMTSSLGVALTNLDEAPLRLNSLALRDVFDNQAGLSLKLFNHYQEAIIKSIFKLLGSINILGNPVGLFKNLSSGISDLIEKPLKGFEKGALEGSLGIVEGASSLVKNTLSGTINSLNKISGSLATGLSSISMDQEFQMDRERRRVQRPNDVFEGVGQGLGSLWVGIERGVEGVLTKPLQGARETGTTGFLKGAFQGITGFVVKPVAGLFDAASKVTEGMKNSVTKFDVKPREERVRPMRAFYSRERYYKQYNHIDADVVTLVNSIKKR